MKKWYAGCAVMWCIFGVALPVLGSGEGLNESRAPVAEVMERGFLGISMKAAGSKAEVTSIVPDSPASSSAILSGDYVIGFNGAGFHFETDLELLKGLRWVRAGDLVEVEVERGTERLTYVLVSAAMTEEARVALDEWIAASETAATRSRQACAFREFQDLVRSTTAIRVAFRRSLNNGDMTITSDAQLPEGLDLGYGDPMLELVYEHLKVGDEVVLEYSVREGMISEGLVEAPQYILDLVIAGVGERFGWDDGDGSWAPTKPDGKH